MLRIPSLGEGTRIQATQDFESVCTTVTEINKIGIKKIK
jgi:hypothetical protein